LIPSEGAAFRGFKKSKGYFEPPRAPRAPRKMRIKNRFLAYFKPFLSFVVLGALGGSSVFVVGS
jgi:hypothetical protein